MSMATVAGRTVAIRRVVSRTRAGLVATALAAGLLLVVAAAIAWVVGGVVVDLAAPLPVAGRVGAFLGWWLAVATATAAFLFVPAIRRPSIDTVAILIERALGGMHNRLLTVIDLARGCGRDEKPEMVERLVDQTASRLSDYRARRVIRGRAVARNLGLAVVAAGLLFGLVVAFGERFTITLARFLDPTADIPPATWLQLSTPGPLEVLEGEPFTVGCSVTRGDTESVMVVLTGSDGTPARYPLRVVASGTFSVAMDGLSGDAVYRFEAGNTWTKTHPIAVLRRPAIDDVTATIRLPRYMRIDGPLAVDPEAPRIEAPFGSTVEFLATVSGDVAEGGARLLERKFERRSVERIDERAWFDDDLPRDAVTTAPWRWTTAAAAGGLRAFAVDHGDGPVAMKTRLEPLVLPKDGLESRSLCVHAKVDPSAPPRALAMTLEADGRALEVLWGDPQALPQSGPKRLVAGPLPTSNDWTRLEAPVAGELAGRSVGSVSFRTDQGRVVLDRPGWLSRRTETVDEPVDVPAGEVSATRGAGNEWLTAVAVDAPRWAAIEFRSPRGHPSLPRPPFELVPTEDRPPQIVIHAPQDKLQLQAPVDVQIEAEAFDDWGLDEIGLRSGPDAERLGPRTPLADVALADRPPDVRRDVRTVIRAESLGLVAGKAIVWRMYVRDTNGRITEGPLRTISVVRPPEHALADEHVPAAREAVREAAAAAAAATRRDALLEEQRRRALEALGEEPIARIDEAKAAGEAATRAAEAARGATDEKREAAMQAAAEAGQRAEHATGRAQETTDRAVAGLESAPQEALAKADAALEAQRSEAGRLAAAATKAAEQARSSPLVPKPQAEALEALAQRAQKLERSLEPDAMFSGETAKVDRVADAPTGGEVAREAAAIGEAIKQVAEAVDAAGAARRIEALAEDLGTRARSLAALADDVASPTPPAAAASTAAPASPATPTADAAATRPQDGSPAEDRRAAQSSPMERVAREQLGQLNRILEAPAANASGDGPQPGDSAVAESSPAPAPRPQDGESPAGDPLPGTPAAGPLAAALEQGAGMARDTAARAADLAAKVAAEAAAAAVAGGETAAAASLAETLSGDAVQSALAMAERARAIAAMQAAADARSANQSNQSNQSNQAAGDGKPGRPGDQEGAQPGEAGTDAERRPSTARGGRGPNAEDQPSTAPVAVLDAERRGLDPATRAAIEKLPPHVRDPLLEGMRQRGPEAYRGVIEAYFRRLGEEIPR